MDKKVTLSTLWIVVLMNIIYADILSFISPGFFDNLIDINQMMLIAFAVLLEIPIMMIYLSRVLNGTALKWSTTISVVLTSLFVIGGGSLSLHYIFFASVEVIVMLYMVTLVWRMKTVS